MPGDEANVAFGRYIGLAGTAVAAKLEERWAPRRRWAALDALAVIGGGVATGLAGAALQLSAATSYHRYRSAAPPACSTASGATSRRLRPPARAGRYRGGRSAFGLRRPGASSTTRMLAHLPPPIAQLIAGARDEVRAVPREIARISRSPGSARRRAGDGKILEDT